MTYKLIRSEFLNDSTTLKMVLWSDTATYFRKLPTEHLTLALLEKTDEYDDEFFDKPTAVPTNAWNVMGSEYYPMDMQDQALVAFDYRLHTKGPSKPSPWAITGFIDALPNADGSPVREPYLLGKGIPEWEKLTKMGAQQARNALEPPGMWNDTLKHADEIFLRLAKEAIDPQFNLTLMREAVNMQQLVSGEPGSTTTVWSGSTDTIHPTHEGAGKKFDELRQQALRAEYFDVYRKLQQGGKWLSAAREWMKCKVPRGDTLTWGSGEPVSIPFHKLEDLALTVAKAAVLEDRARGSALNKEIKEVLEGLLALPEAVKQLEWLDRGVGTATYQAYWLRARALRERLK